MENQLCKFTVDTLGNFQRISETISKCRCSIFYKGENRNGTYITDEFAEKLLATLPYAPVKGIFNAEDGDFTDHGKSRNLGRIYGVVPAQNNFAWETRLDEDGVSRTYACTDVYIYTALYPEANIIPGKSQSMELYYKTIKGDWKFINGKRLYVYEDGCFLGLQALGDITEPCFEGAQFFALYQSLKDITNEMEKYSFQKEDKLMSNEALQTNEMPDVVETTETAEVVETVEATNDSTESTESAQIELTEQVEKNAPNASNDAVPLLNTLTERGISSLEELNNHFVSFDKMVQEILDKNTKIEESQVSLSTLVVERDNAISDAKSAREQLAQVIEERDALASYKKSTEDNAKLAVINEYADTLPDEIIEKYISNLDNYNLEELDMNLTYEQKKAHPETFSTNNTGAAFVPKDEPKTGIISILDKYEKH